jgi:hypothetical protein
MGNPKASPAAIAHLEQVMSYYSDPSQAPHDNPPKPPTADIAIELTASIAQLVAIAIDFERTGEIHMEPSVEARMTAAEMVDKRLPP